MLEGAANRTFMLVVVEETSGLPFECPKPGSVGLCGHSIIVGTIAYLDAGNFI
jgi:hypothetical protein